MNSEYERCETSAAESITRNYIINTTQPDDENNITTATKSLQGSYMNIKYATQDRFRPDPLIACFEAKQINKT